jgi:hypothetical protein
MDDSLGMRSEWHTAVGDVPQCREILRGRSGKQIGSAHHLPCSKPLHTGRSFFYLVAVLTCSSQTRLHEGVRRFLLLGLGRPARCGTAAPPAAVASSRVPSFGWSFTCPTDDGSPYCTPLFAGLRSIGYGTTMPILAAFESA